MTPTELSPEQNAEREALFRTALDCYLNTIQHIAEFLGAVAPELASPHQEQLIKLRQRLAFEPTRQTLLESQEILDRELEAVAAKAGDSRDAKVNDLRRISVILAQADDAFLIRNHGCTDQLRHLTKELDKAESLEDPAQAREKLTAQLSELRTFVDTIQEDSSHVFARLQDQIEEFRANLTMPEAVASFDAVTALPNLREFARQIASRLNTTTPFCLLTFNLQGFDQVAKTSGPLFEDEILRQVGTGLASQIRARDLACRWEGGKFLVILECGLVEATARARQIALWLSGHYRAEIEGQEKIAELKVVVGITERHPDDGLHELVQRAESSLPGL